MLPVLEHIMQAELDDTHEESLSNHGLDPNSVQQIQTRYQNRSSRLREYRFPRQKQSIASSIASHSLQQPTYDLLSQNKQYLKQSFEDLVVLEQSHVKARQQKRQRQEDHIHILNVREIRKLTRESAQKPQSRMKVTTNQKSPEHPIKKTQFSKFPIKRDPYISPPKETGWRREKSRKKIMVLSSNKRTPKIQEFVIEQEIKHSPVRKGLVVVSKQKRKEKGKSIQRSR